jgi:hypothetical protein
MVTIPIEKVSLIQLEEGYLHLLPPLVDTIAVKRPNSNLP